MDFDLPDGLQDFLDRLDSFIEAEIAPLQAQDDNERFFDHRREWARTDFDNGGLPRPEWEALMAEAVRRADAAGLTLAPSTAAQVLALRGVLETRAATGMQDADLSALEAEFEALLGDFVAMRAAEGTALAELIADQLDRIAALVSEAEGLLEARAEAISEAHRTALARVGDQAGQVPPERIAQELALVAVRLDVTEEIDRLRAHVAAARDLLAQGSPVGRKLDFLAQEFMREANTLCSKAQNAALTAAGLGLKTVIDRMREQIQNVE